MSLLPPAPLRFTLDGYFTLEQYLGIERATGRRYEYHDGHLVSVELMAGGSANHSRHAGSLSFIGMSAREAEADRLADCDAHGSDLRIAVEGGRRYLYADAVIVCGAPTYDTLIPSAIANPVTVFEVLSSSSEGYDRGLKFEFYGALTSVREYVLISQDRRWVEVRQRPSAEAAWQVRTVIAEDGEVTIPSLEIALPMSKLYRNWVPPERDDAAA